MWFALPLNLPQLWLDRDCHVIIRALSYTFHLSCKNQLKAPKLRFVNPRLEGITIDASTPFLFLLFLSCVNVKPFAEVGGSSGFPNDLRTRLIGAFKRIIYIVNDVNGMLLPTIAIHEGISYHPLTFNLAYGTFVYSTQIVQKFGQHFALIQD